MVSWVYTKITQALNHASVGSFTLWDIISALIVGGFFVCVGFCVKKHKEENERLDCFRLDKNMEVRE